MANYSPITDFSAKDALTSGDPEKKILGADVDAELNAIAAAIQSKYDSSNLASQNEAETGSSNVVLMTPLRTQQWADANAGIVGDLRALNDPNADRLLFWDDSAGAAAFLSVGSNLSLSGTTLDVGSNVPLKNAPNTFSDANTFSSATIADLAVTGSITLPSASIADAALSGNVPLKDAPNTFVALQTLAYEDPSIQLVETDADANEKVWWIRVQSSRFIIQGRQDNGSASGAVNIIDITRNTGALSAAEIELNADLLDFNGSATVSGASRFESTARSVSAPAVRIGESGSTNTAGVLSVVTASNPNLVLFNSTSGAEGLFQVGTSVLIGAETAHTLSFRTNATSRMSIDAAGDVSMTGALSVGGAVRAGTAATSTSATLAAGQIHHRSSNTTVPSMNAGQWVAVQNTSTSSITLSQGSGVTLELAGTTTTGNRTLLPKGFAFIYFRANGVGVCGGAGVS